MRNAPIKRKKKSKLLDFLKDDGVQLKEPGLRLSHFTVLLMFLVCVGAIIATIVTKSPWPIASVAGALGFRSIPAFVAVLKRPKEEEKGT